MSELLCLIDTRKIPTREESSTLGRKAGDEFIAAYAPDCEAKYCGYLVSHGQFAPFWRFDKVPTVLMRNLRHLNAFGYIGKIERVY